MLHLILLRAEKNHLEKVNSNRKNKDDFMVQGKSSESIGIILAHVYVSRSICPGWPG